MTKTEMINALADYYHIDVELDEYGNPIGYDWESGAYLGVDGEWLSLANVVSVLEYLCDDDD